MADKGWIGTQAQLLHYLRVVGADQDKYGKFVVQGNIVSFMGLDIGPATEMVVGPNVMFFKDGQACNLAVGLGSTSYGSRPFVII